jgi:transposase
LLRALVLSAKAGIVTRRLLALVTIYDGGTRADAARLGGVGLQTLRDWVLRFNAKGPDGLVDGKSTGRPSLLDDAQRRALVAMVEAGPTPAIHEVVRWRLIDLAQWVFDEYGLSVTKQILSRELRALGYRKLSARPRHHEHDEAAVAAFKKKSRPSWRPSPPPPTSRSKSGSKTKPASAKKTRSRGGGPNAARDLSP